MDQGDIQSDTLATEKSEQPEQPEAVVIEGDKPPTNAIESTELLSLLRDNNQTIAEVKTLITDRLIYDEAKEKAFNRLYEQMKAQKEQNAIIDRAIKPLFLDLLLYYDNLKKFEGYLKELDTQDKQEVMDQVTFLIEEVLEIFYRQDIERIPENFMKFDKKFQKAVRAMATDSMEEDLNVLQVTRDGFTWRDQILRSQEVVIKKFTGQEVS